MFCLLESLQSTEAVTWPMSLKFPPQITELNLESGLLDNIKFIENVLSQQKNWQIFYFLFNYPVYDRKLNF